MGAEQPSAFASFVPIIAIFLIFYFLVIRPQQKQMKDHKKMLEALKKGDRILTSGGIYATITGVLGPDLDVKIADNVKVRIARSAVSRLANPAHELASGKKKDR